MLQTHSVVGRIQFLRLKHLSSQPLETACGLHALQSRGQNVELPRALNPRINFVLTAGGEAVLENPARSNQTPASDPHVLGLSN